MTTPKPYHTSIYDNYGTPQPFFDVVSQEFGPFDLDVCADALSAKCPIYFDQVTNGLAMTWFGVTWMNPPYGSIAPWIIKQIQSVQSGSVERSVALVAARPDTQWFQAAASWASEIRFLKGRLKFEIPTTQDYRAEIAKRVWDRIYGGDPKEVAFTNVALDQNLPRSFVRAVWVDPTTPLMQSAPFPSALLIFDRSPSQTICFWDWKLGVKIKYHYQGPVLKSAFPVVVSVGAGKKGHVPGNMPSW